MAEDHKKDAEMRLLYQGGLDHIRDLKRQQWAVTYYALLLYAALVGVLEVARDHDFLEEPLQHVVAIVAVFVAAAAIGVILKLQASLLEPRRRLVAIEDQHFDPAVKDLPGAGRDGYTSFLHQWPIWGLMITVALAGAVLVNWLTWAEGD